MKKLVLPMLMVVAGLGAWTCMGSHVPDIEADLTSRTIQALAEAGIVYTGEERVYFQDTLTARLRGYPNSREISVEAQEVALNVFGVTSVSFEEIEGKPPEEDAPPAAAPEPRPSPTNTLEKDPVRDRIKVRIDEVLKVETVEFVNGKAVLTDKGKDTLDRIVSIVYASQEAIEIQGHTDSVGNPVKNRALSKERAESAKAYLVARGIAAARLTTVGFGPDRPVADNASDAGRSRNRRIEFRLKETVVKKAN